MRSQIAAALCSAILAFAAGSLLPIAQAAPGNASQANTSIRDLMDSIVDPSADVIWGASGTIVDKDQGIVELFPKTAEGWMDVRRAAVRIIGRDACRAAPA